MTIHLLVYQFLNQDGNTLTGNFADDGLRNRVEGGNRKVDAVGVLTRRAGVGYDTLNSLAVREVDDFDLFAAERRHCVNVTISVLVYN